MAKMCISIQKKTSRSFLSPHNLKISSEFDIFRCYEADRNCVYFD